MQGYSGPARAAAEIAAAAIREARRTSSPLPDVLGRTSFTTALGTVRFDVDGNADLGLFRVFRFDGKDFAPATGG